MGEDKRPITMGDMIRQMNDQEMASYLTDVELRIRRLNPKLDREATYFSWLEFLQQIVE